MYEKLLTEIGLTKSEIAVYIALLPLGASTTGPIARISSGKIYEVLEKLIDKGLVTYVTRSGRKYFRATSPNRIQVYLEKKEQDLKRTKRESMQMIQELESLQSTKEGITAEIFEGIEGFKTFSEFCLRKLKKNTDYCILGVSKEVNDLFGGYLFDWQRRRARKGVSLRIVYSHDAIVHGQKRVNLEFTKVRYLPKKVETPALIEVFDEYVATIIMGPPIVFLIRSKKAADSYLAYFNMMWKMAQ
jgi:HTH-type transcriptional regulator, sugar sensing transcriptional regulator